MSTLKLQGPANFGGLSHAGQSYEPDEDGVIEVPSHLPSDLLAAHGLTAVEPKKGPKKLEPLAKLAKGGDPDENEGSGDGQSGEGEKAKAPVKGAKLAKGGDQ